MKSNIRNEDIGVCGTPVVFLFCVCKGLRGSSALELAEGRGCERTNQNGSLNGQMKTIRDSHNLIGIHDDDHWQIAYSNSEPRLIHVCPQVIGPSLLPKSFAGEGPSHFLLHAFRSPPHKQSQGLHTRPPSSTANSFHRQSPNPTPRHHEQHTFSIIESCNLPVQKHQEAPEGGREGAQ